MHTRSKIVTAALTGVLALGVTPAIALADTSNSTTITTVEGNNAVVAKVGEQTFNSLQEAVSAAITSGQTLVLESDVTLTSSIRIPSEGGTLTIDGNDKTISLSASGWTGGSYAVFCNLPGGGATEGVPSSTTINVNNAKFVGHTSGQADHVVVVTANAEKVDLEFTNCHFTHLYDVVYANFVNNAQAEPNSIAISGCVFNDVAHAYGVDDGYTYGGRTDKYDVDIQSDAPEAETFAIVSVDGVGYTGREADGTGEVDADAAFTQALAAAKDGETITVRKDAELDTTLSLNRSVSVDLDGHTLTGSDAATGDLVKVAGNNVSIANGKLATGSNGKNVVSVDNASGVVLRGVTLDHSSAADGVALAVSTSSVTLDGKVTAVTSEKDTSAATVSGTNASLTVDKATGSLELEGDGSNTVKAEQDGKVDLGTSGEQLADGTYGKAVARIGNKAYGSLEEAIGNAQKGDTIELVSDAAVEKCLILSADNVTIDGNGHQITAAANVLANTDGLMHLLTVTGKGATIKDVDMFGTGETKHVLNIWCAGTARLENVTLNHSASLSGAPLVVNNTDVTVAGKFEVVTGVNSWYGINLDNKYGKTSFTIAGNCTPVFIDVSGKDLDFIKSENSGSATEGLPTVTVDNPNLGITGNNGEFDLHTHDFEIQGAIEPTADKPGYTGDKVCTICGEKIPGQAIPALGYDNVAMYRLYNRYTGEHLYTSDADERAVLIKLGWNDEGVAWVAPGKSDSPVYRLYNPYSDDHHFTMDEDEYNDLAKLGWKQEGIAWYSADKDDEGAQPLYRLFNPYEDTATHLYTANEDEYNDLAKLGWRQEGIAWYGLSVKE